MACPTVSLTVGLLTVVFDCETADTDGNSWIWTSIPGWYEPPTPYYDTFPLKDDAGEHITNAQWLPRTITLGATAIIGDSGSLDAARSTLTALCDMLITPGQFTVDDGITPMYATVYLSDKPQHGRVLGDGHGLEVQIPMVAYDVYRRRVSDAVGFL